VSDVKREATCRGCGCELKNPLDVDGLCSETHCYDSFVEYAKTLGLDVRDRRGSDYVVDWSRELVRMAWDAWCDAGQPPASWLNPLERMPF
jgi:hypothetical protein